MGSPHQRIAWGRAAANSNLLRTSYAKIKRGNREKEEQIRSTDADEGRVRIRWRNNFRGGATTGRINSQPKRSKHRGKSDPAEEE